MGAGGSRRLGSGLHLPAGQAGKLAGSHRLRLPKVLIPARNQRQAGPGLRFFHQAEGAVGFHVKVAHLPQVLQAFAPQLGK